MGVDITQEELENLQKYKGLLLLSITGSVYVISAFDFEYKMAKVKAGGNMFTGYVYTNVRYVCLKSIKYKVSDDKIHLIKDKELSGYIYGERFKTDRKRCIKMQTSVVLHGYKIIKK